MEPRLSVLICSGTGCASNKSMEVMDALRKEIATRGLEQEVEVVQTGCQGFCAVGPIVYVQPDDVFYQQVGVKDVPRLVEEHFLKGRPYKDKLYVPPMGGMPIPKLMDIPFFKSQVLVALRNKGLIDPEKIEDYIARDGYQALARVLTEMKPEQVIECVTKSGLRGRGGGGFPTGVKWASARKASGDIKYVLCNGDEGDPGAFMDRSIMEGDPHSVLEGMCIAAFAVGSSQGYVYVRKEYPLAVQRIEVAIEQAREFGLLGKDILGAGFDFDVEVRRGAGAFVCGESTALMASIEGNPGEPRAKYIHTVDAGLWNRPSCLNNVETFANVPMILQRGWEWFSSIGTGDVSQDPWGGSKGTKVFSIAGDVNNTGLIEVPMGTTLREIVFDIAGGLPEGKRFKAVQTGGPSGGFLPESLLNLPVDFDRLVEAGSMMGSGGMVVLGHDKCMVDSAKFFIDFTADESCGKCTPCRIGSKIMLQSLEKISEGKATEEDVEQLERVAHEVANLSLCGLGKSAPNPVLTALRYFRDEVMAHVHEKRCPAGECKALITYSIDAGKCTGCTLCAKNCPTDCITGERKAAHAIVTDRCIKCGSCKIVCNFDAVVVQ
ncbi:MAG: NADH-quinone oxidoreductase subunit NuoF [Deltaproteobacteria bacterium]|nr:NADH-quinone oxidoreductase subunit NuoF [Deltaproteobacteria bacterium]